MCLIIPVQWKCRKKEITVRHRKKKSVLNCVPGINEVAITHFEEWKQQLDAFTVQPGSDKRELSVCLWQGLMGSQRLKRGRKWMAVCENRISCLWHSCEHTCEQTPTRHCLYKSREDENEDLSCQRGRQRYLGAWLISGCGLYLGKL